MLLRSRLNAQATLGSRRSRGRSGWSRGGRLGAHRGTFHHRNATATAIAAVTAVAAAVAAVTTVAAIAAVAAMTTVMTVTTVMAATAIAGAVATAVAAAVTSAATTVAAVTGDRLVVAAHQGDADDREEDRDPKHKCTIHPKLLQTNRYPSDLDSNQLFAAANQLPPPIVTATNEGHFAQALGGLNLSICN